MERVARKPLDKRFVHAEDVRNGPGWKFAGTGLSLCALVGLESPQQRAERDWNRGFCWAS